MSPNTESSTNENASTTWICGKAGALTAALVFLATYMIHATVWAMMTPHFIGMLPLVFALALPWAAGATVPGAIIGVLAAKSGRLSVAAAIGLVVALPVGAIAAFAFSAPGKPSLHDAGLFMLLAGEPGACAGMMAAWCSRSQGTRLKTSRPELSKVHAALILLALFLPLATWCAYLFCSRI